MFSAGKDLLAEICKNITEPAVQYSRTDPPAPSSIVVDFVRDDNNNNYGFLAYVISGMLSNPIQIHLAYERETISLKFIFTPGWNKKAKTQLQNLQAFFVSTFWYFSIFGMLHGMVLEHKIHKIPFTFFTITLRPLHSSGMQ